MKIFAKQISNKGFVFKIYRESTEKTYAFKFESENLLYKHIFLFITHFSDYKTVQSA